MKADRQTDIQTRRSQYVAPLQGKGLEKQNNLFPVVIKALYP